jgi:predicted Rossmann fold nucleotide-binding protein DprA/Smf involved in DNA uptake
MATNSMFVSDSELERQHSVLLVTLYLRGLKRFAEPKRSAWPAVLSKLRLECASISLAPTALRRHGFDLEASLADDVKLVREAERLHHKCRVLSSLDSLYPVRWLERLGTGAPPALWWNGKPWNLVPSVTIVGSRRIGKETESWTRKMGTAAVESGYLVVSGAAAGCDASAIQGALGAGGLTPSASVSILPCGINTSASRDSALLSVCEPNAPFSAALAMERNTLLYACSEWAIVAHSQFRKGGTWAGCTDALRRRLCQIAVSNWSDEMATRALCALGARQIQGWRDFERVKTQPEAGVLPMVYSYGFQIDGQVRVQERSPRYLAQNVA